MTYAAAGVTVRIGRALLVEAVDLEIVPGQIVVVAGPNGAGKTTLIRALAGDVEPHAGSVSLDDRALADWPGDELAQRRAVMSTDRAVAFGFTATEVALLGRLPVHGGAPRDADRAVVAELLAAVDCAALADRVYATLSTGERQRVALARAVAQVRADYDEHRYLLLDEPTSSLDPAHQHTAMRLLRAEAKERGVGILAVVHDLNLAAAYADRLVLMRKGRMAASGSPSEVLRPDVLEAVFDIPMLVIAHPQLAHPLVVAEPRDP